MREGRERGEEGGDRKMEWDGNKEEKGQVLEITNGET